MYQRSVSRAVSAGFSMRNKATNLAAWFLAASIALSLPLAKTAIGQ